MEKGLPGSFGNTQVLCQVFVLASGAAAAVVEASAGTDGLHHTAFVDLDSGYLAAGDTAVVQCSAACAASGQVAVLGVHVFQGTALAAAVAAAVVVVAVDGNHAGCLVVLAGLDMLQAVALVGIPVAEGVPDRTAVIAFGAQWTPVLDKTEDVFVPGSNVEQGGSNVVQGAHDEVLVLSLVVVVVVVVVGLAAEMFASDCHVVCIVDSLAVAVVPDMETAAVVAAAVIGDLEMPADFPIK